MSRSKKVWWIVIQNTFGRENIGGLHVCVEVNQQKVVKNFGGLSNAPLPPKDQSTNYTAS